MNRAKLVTFVAIVSMFAGASACTDPVHDDAVSSLGGEENGVRRGPTHRPGQPCLTCHSDDGPGEPAFSIAGTVYATREQPDPAPGVTIQLIDARGDEKTLISNSVGNFYVATGAWSPTFPVRVSISQDNLTVPMQTLINGAGSCASCHRGDPTQGSMPPVYLRNE